MSDDQRIASSEHYFQQYREKLRRTKDMEERRRELDEAYQKDRSYLHEQMRNLNNELQNMRRVITRMVEEGIDPTVAKIMMDESYTRDMWQGDAFSTTGYESISSVDISDQIDMSMTIGSISTTGSIGTISLAGMGAVGAMGATGATGYGANGPPGPYVTYSNDGDA